MFSSLFISTFVPSLVFWLLSHYLLPTLVIVIFWVREKGSCLRHIMRHMTSNQIATIDFLAVVINDNLTVHEVSTHSWQVLKLMLVKLGCSLELMAITIDVRSWVLLVLRIKDEVVHVVCCSTLSAISWRSLHVDCIFALSIVCIRKNLSIFWPWTQHNSTIPIKGSIIWVMPYSTRLIKIASKIYILASKVLLSIFAINCSLILVKSWLKTTALVSHWIMLIRIICRVLGSWKSTIILLARTEIVWN